MKYMNFENCITYHYNQLFCNKTFNKNIKVVNKRDDDKSDAVDEVNCVF